MALCGKVWMGLQPLGLGTRNRTRICLTVLKMAEQGLDGKDLVTAAATCPFGGDGPKSWTKHFWGSYDDWCPCAKAGQCVCDTPHCPHVAYVGPTAGTSISNFTSSGNATVGGASSYYSTAEGRQAMTAYASGASDFTSQAYQQAPSQSTRRGSRSGHGTGQGYSSQPSGSGQYAAQGYGAHSSSSGGFEIQSSASNTSWGLAQGHYDSSQMQIVAHAGPSGTQQSQGYDNPYLPAAGTPASYLSGYGQHDSSYGASGSMQSSSMTGHSAPQHTSVSYASGSTGWQYPSSTQAQPTGHEHPQAPPQASGTAVAKPHKYWAGYRLVATMPGKQ